MDEQSAQAASEETVEQPQESQESTEVETDHVQDETHESEAQASTETPESAPQAEKAPKVEEEPEWKPEPYKAPEVATPDIRKFVDADGNLDLAAYNTAQAEWANGIVNAATQAAMQVGSQQTAYQREWSKAEDKFPELKTNRQLKDMTQAIHANSAQPGFKYLSPLKAAEQLFALRGEARSDGMKAAKESRTVQAAAGLSNPNPPATTQSDNKAGLKEKMKTGTKFERAEATREYLKLIL